MKKILPCLVLLSALLMTGCNKPAETPTTPEANKPAPVQEVAGTCDKACENYALCTGYGDDVTPQDLDDAYATCMEECAGWQQENITCMAKAVVRNPQDCLAVTMCGLKQYEGLTLPE